MKENVGTSGVRPRGQTSTSRPGLGRPRGIPLSGVKSLMPRVYFTENFRPLRIKKGFLKMEEAAKKDLVDASKFIFFDDQGTVLASNFQVNTSELKALMALFGERDDAIRHGMIVGEQRYEVHRHHPPLVYGRTMGHSPETSEGIAICQVEKGSDGGAAYGLITYQMPNISARMVPILQKFCETHITA
eukprot:gene14582-20629_t